MKRLIVILSVIFVGCSGGKKDKNEIMTDFLNERKATEEGIKSAKYHEDDFQQKAKTEIRASHDTLKWHPLIDSSTVYYMKGDSLKKRLKDIEFSIDSLSKMK